MELLKPGNPWSNENFEIRRHQLGAEILANSRRPTHFGHSLVQDPPLLRRPPESAMPDRGAETTNDHPWNVQQAARFLGVSPQTVYLWVERKQIPHLRVMGRNIRFLRSDLKTFRASFRQDVEKV